MSAVCGNVSTRPPRNVISVSIEPPAGEDPSGCHQYGPGPFGPPSGEGPDPAGAARLRCPYGRAIRAGPRSVPRGPRREGAPRRRGSRRARPADRVLRLWRPLHAAGADGSRSRARSGRPVDGARPVLTAAPAPARRAQGRPVRGGAARGDHVDRHDRRVPTSDERDRHLEERARGALARRAAAMRRLGDQHGGAFTKLLGILLVLGIIATAALYIYGKRQQPLSAEGAHVGTSDGGRQSGQIQLAPGRSVYVATIVRNDGPLPVTLEGLAPAQVSPTDAYVPVSIELGDGKTPKPATGAFTPPSLDAHTGIGVVVTYTINPNMACAQFGATPS